MYQTIALFAVLVLLARYRFRIVPADVRIVDGDTVRVRGDDWRLTGFDAPEWDQPGGKASTAHLATILRSGHTLAILRGLDAYDRPLATLITTRGPLSWRMALAGHAHGEGLVCSTLTLVARIARRGMWGMPGTIRPRNWRAGLR